MNSFLTLPDNRKKAAYEQTSAAIKVPASYIEKDLWVCWVLKELFVDEELASHLTFRGGTSLSKAFGLIARFSEDIDLSVSRSWLGINAENAPENATNPSQLQRRQKELRKRARERLLEVIAPKLQSRLEKLGLNADTWSLELNDEENDLESARDPYCLFLNYPCLTGVQQTDYIRSRVKIEFSARAEGTPDENATLTSFVAEQFPKAFQNPQFSVRVVSPARTFWEKCFIIHEENTAPETRQKKVRLSRHYYDLYCLITKGTITLDETLFQTVKNHRAVHFNQSWVDYETITPQQLMITPETQKDLEDWEKDYQLMESMIYGDFPDLTQTFEVIESILLPNS